MLYSYYCYWVADMELFYKLLCAVGLAKVHNFKTKVGSFVITDEVLIGKPDFSFVVYDELKKRGAPVCLDTLQLPSIKEGYILERNNRYSDRTIEFTWYRKDYRYVVHPALRFMGCK